MALVSEAIARYHKLIESEPYIDLAWAQALQERKKALKLNGGVSPVLRPHFLTQRELVALEKAAELIASAHGACGADRARLARSAGPHASVAGGANAGRVGARIFAPSTSPRTCTPI